MTPQQKADELVNKFKKETDGIAGYNYDSVNTKCALIAVDEIINHHSQEQGLYRIDTYYWQEVKQEIEKL